MLVALSRDCETRCEIKVTYRHSLLRLYVDYSRTLQDVNQEAWLGISNTPWSRKGLGLPIRRSDKKRAPCLRTSGRQLDHASPADALTVRVLIGESSHHRISQHQSQKASQSLAASHQARSSPQLAVSVGLICRPGSHCGGCGTWQTTSYDIVLGRPSLPCLQKTHKAERVSD